AQTVPVGLVEVSVEPRPSQVARHDDHVLAGLSQGDAEIGCRCGLALTLSWTGDENDLDPPLLRQIQQCRTGGAVCLGCATGGSANRDQASLVTASLTGGLRDERDDGRAEILL